MRTSALLCGLLLAIPAGAGTPPDVQPQEVHPELVGADVEVIRGFYYIASSRPEYAVDIATRILQQDPDMISAHRVYMYGLLEMREVDLVLSIYQNWHKASPEDPVRRAALAWASMARQDEIGAWCDEVEALTRDASSSGAAGYWQHRARFEAAKKCYFDGAASRLELIEIGKHVEEAWGYRLRLLLSDRKEVDEALSAELLSFGTAFPNRLAYLPNIWASSYKGSGLTTAREGLLELAWSGAESHDPVELYEASLVLGRADLDDEQATAMARLDELDPGRAERVPIYTSGERGFFTPRPTDRVTELELQVQDLVDNHERRELIRALRTLDSELPRSGRARAAWYGAKATAESELGRVDEALESRRLQWISEPDGTIAKDLAANQYAWSAAVQGRDLERALEAIDSALAGLPTWDPRDPQFVGRNYEEWLSLQRRRTGAWLDTRGWILYRMNRMDEALIALQQAILMRPDPDPEIILHLGLIHAALQNEDEALLYLSRGLSLASPADPLAIEAREVAEALFINRRWTGTQLDGWIEGHRPSQQSHSTVEADGTEDYRFGKPFPDLEFKINGKSQRLSDYSGIRVVDLWASWCSPCVDALPHVNELAEKYQALGVTVIAISVDDGPGKGRKDLKELGDLHFISAWAGPDALPEARVQSIPSVFIVDADQNILAYIKGFQDEGDDRVAEQLDAILEGPTSSPEESP